MNTTPQTLAQDHPAKPPWSHKSVWVAFVIMILGSFLWIKDHNPAKVSSGVPPPGVSQFSDSRSTTPPSVQNQTNPSSPAIFRLGASYLGGFFLGWMLRRFMKLTWLALGAAVCFIAIGQKLGWFNVDWNWFETHVRQSLAWVHGEAESFRTFVTGLLPSTGAAVIGTFFGIRSK